MRPGLVLAAAVAGVVTAQNPFTGKTLFVNPLYTAKLEQTYKAFASRGDTANANKVRTVQKLGSFVWIANLSNLQNIDQAITQARQAQSSTGVKQVVGLILYNLPDRDCSGGQAAGEFKSGSNGMNRYKNEFVTPFARKVSAATDLTFAVIVEPDSLGNVITNMNIPFCAQAAPLYEEGIAYTISNLQYTNVHLYVDITHGGWLGWDSNLPLAAAEVAKVMKMAKAGSKIRGFATNVSSTNPFNGTAPETWQKDSNSWDESRFVSNLAPHMASAGLPTNFIVDQGRVRVFGQIKEWGEWCNVAPAGFGIPPGTPTSNPNVDHVVWAKPGGESDGQCGPTAGAPVAGTWFEAYAEMLTRNADPRISRAGYLEM